MFSYLYIFWTVFFSCVLVCFHNCRSHLTATFVITGVFDIVLCSLGVCFHVCTFWTGLFSCVLVCFHVYRSLLTATSVITGVFGIVLFAFGVHFSGKGLFPGLFECTWVSLDTGWLRLVGSLELQVSFAEYCLFYRALLQKWLII